LDSETAESHTVKDNRGNNYKNVSFFLIIFIYLSFDYFSLRSNLY